MRFRNYGVAKSMRARRAYSGYGDDSGCSAGYSPDANGNCVNAQGAGDGCPAGAGVDSSGNCLTSSGDIAGCPPGTTLTDANGNCLDNNGNTIPGGTAATGAGGSTTPATSSGTGSILTGIGTTLTSIFGPKPAVRVASSGTSILLPAIFAVGAIGAVVYFTHKKK